ncbi:hypothetical protein BUALT_Bualt07G0012700 [Buddleja alternifolia]|uniref:Protein kinase domain-containing protein n=1 Tax=Buddleja alternifolia TaxID=168488 RepID=A0AAV6XDP4_9LAMI|nr:hypothetical protein BUALT_Bualt07G0012700 [Buddleja alternifolia]
MINIHPFPISLLFFCFLKIFTAAVHNNVADHFTITGDVSINCGSSGTSAARNGRAWPGDVNPKTSSLVQIKGTSTTSTLNHISADPVPYKTARISRSQFSYQFFKLNPGQKILRLHFNPATYKGFKRYDDFFTVEAGPFTLLSNFSASLTADALGVDSLTKEFCINIQDYQEFNIIFFPANGQSYTFINGIEILSVPASLSYFNKGDVDGGMLQVVGEKYLVRLHFSKLGFKMAETAGLVIKIYINEMIANTHNISTVRERDDDNSNPLFRDYIVMMKGRQQECKHNLLICLQSNDEFMDGYGPVKGFEIMKAVPTILIAILALVNIVIHTLVQIREASCTKEENKPSARAKRLCRQFRLAELQLATRDFSDAHFIGRGGFELRHVNLVSLIGYCNEHGEMILVYEYMAGGTLADHLYKLARNNSYISSLTWKQRLNICIGAGRGLDYLHTGHSIIHRDVKASNILLDENFIAKFSDFGLAKHENRSKLQSHVTTNVKGTFGYFDPYYVTTRKLTRKSDTFAFGVVLFEVLCGRPALDTRVAEDERRLTNWARDNISKGKIDQIVASNLRGEISEDSLKAFVRVVERCLHEEPKGRPTMAQVVLQLEVALEQQERIKPSSPNGITSDVDDNIRPSNDEETNLSVGTGELTMPSTDVQKLAQAPIGQTQSRVVNAEPSGKKDKPARLWSWNTFWNRVKISTKNEWLLSGTNINAKTLLSKVRNKETSLMIFSPIIKKPEDLAFLEKEDGLASFNIIGKGGCGEVYKGVLPGGNGKEIAIKKIIQILSRDAEELKRKIAGF